MCCCAEPFQDLLALRYCLCSIGRSLALQCADEDGSNLTLHLRRMLFFAFSSWTEEGAVPGQNKSVLEALINGGVSG